MLLLPLSAVAFGFFLSFSVSCFTAAFGADGVLLAIGVDDLMKPFAAGDVYVRAMGGSNSIKAVLPALFPHDPDLDYHALEGVHNGSEAMAVYAQLADMAPEQAEQVRQQLLSYCELDTLAMVKIYQFLIEVAR